ncbi:hypothetical protein SprV_0401434900 [Sparganum proliferum]
MREGRKVDSILRNAILFVRITNALLSRGDVRYALLITTLPISIPESTLKTPLYRNDRLQNCCILPS